MTALGEVGQGIEPLMTICCYMITNRVRLGEPERWGCSWTERGTRCLTPGPEGPPGCVTHPGRRGHPAAGCGRGLSPSGLLKGQLGHKPGAGGDPSDGQPRQ